MSEKRSSPDSAWSVDERGRDVFDSSVASAIQARRRNDQLELRRLNETLKSMDTDARGNVIVYRKHDDGTEEKLGYAQSAYIFGGDAYLTRQDAINYLLSQGYSETEAEEYVDTMPPKGGVKGQKNWADQVAAFIYLEPTDPVPDGLVDRLS